MALKIFPEFSSLIQSLLDQGFEYDSHYTLTHLYRGHWEVRSRCAELSDFDALVSDEIADEVTG